MDLNAPIGPSPTILSESREAEADNKLWKLFLLLVLGSLANILCIFFFLKLLIGAEYGYFGYALAAAALFLVFVILQSFFIKSGSKLFGLLLLESLVPLGFFAKELMSAPSPILIVGSVIAAVLVAMGGLRGSRALSETIKIRFFEIAKIATPKVTTGIVLLLSVVMYVSYFEAGHFNEATAEIVFKRTLALSEPALQIWVPGTSFSNTLERFLSTSAERELGRITSGGPSLAVTDTPLDLSSLTPVAKKKILSEISTQIRLAIERTTGPLNPTAPLGDELYRVASNYFKKFSSVAKFATGIGVSVLFFFALKGIFAVLYWAAWLVAFLLFKFLLSVNFAHIALQTRSREFVVL